MLGPPPHLALGLPLSLRGSRQNGRRSQNGFEEDIELLEIDLSRPVLVDGVEEVFDVLHGDRQRRRPFRGFDLIDQEATDN
jgi:hypothetical protein